ncbi:MAG: UTP--glucose-1-phosphate uridylyltransferase [Christensenellaceae bacterium]|jgi:UTP--glucose-1-phosphate uridylyltransferase|nr:UTP--glucose-1-phosphate uridylyltransferase [Christensenellaceae bacterium]
MERKGFEIKKAVIPVAGFGTRFLPATKAVPKELLPVVDRPALEYIVDECIASGITEICFLIARGKEAIKKHFGTNIELEAQLKSKISREKTDGKNCSETEAFLSKITRYADKVKFVYIMQEEMLGTAKALEICRVFTGDEPFAVLFGDDVMYTGDGKPVTKQLIDAYYATKTPIIGVQQMTDDIAIKCGVLKVADMNGKYIKIAAFKEKPQRHELKNYSNYTSLGRFIITPEVLDCVPQPPMTNGEYYLTDTVTEYMKSAPVYAYDFDGLRYDIGSKIGFLKANIEFALRNNELSIELHEYLTTLK